MKGWYPFKKKLKPNIPQCSRPSNIPQTFNESLCYKLIFDMDLLNIYHSYPIERIFPLDNYNLQPILNVIKSRIQTLHFIIDEDFIENMVVYCFPIKNHYPQYFYFKKIIVSIELQKKPKFYSDLITWYCNEVSILSRIT